LRQPSAAATVDAGLDPAAVRDTIASVFTDPAYDQSLRQSLGDRVLEWIFRTLGAIVEALRGSADIRWLVIGAAILIVSVVVARAFFLSAEGARRRTRRPGAARTRGIDPWAQAAAEADAGRYTDAAHLLYAAVLNSLASSHRLVLHHAKTAGEYQNELRTRAPHALPPFTAFTRAYEKAIWGTRGCDQQEYSRLLDLATCAVHAGPQEIAA
jgi:hypothetical protein